MPNKQNKKEAGSDLFEKSELSQDRVKKRRRHYLDERPKC